MDNVDGRHPGPDTPQRTQVELSAQESRHALLQEKVVGQKVPHHERDTGERDRRNHEVKKEAHHLLLVQQEQPAEDREDPAEPHAENPHSGPAEEHHQEHQERHDSKRHLPVLERKKTVDEPDGPFHDKHHRVVGRTEGGPHDAFVPYQYALDQPPENHEHEVRAQERLHLFGIPPQHGRPQEEQEADRIDVEEDVFDVEGLRHDHESHVAKDQGRHQRHRPVEPELMPVQRIKHERHNRHRHKVQRQYHAVHLEPVQGNHQEEDTSQRLVHDERNAHGQEEKAQRYQPRIVRIVGRHIDVCHQQGKKNDKCLR